MREILFRGKRKHDGEWVVGYYLEKTDPLLNSKMHFILFQDSNSGFLTSLFSWNVVDPNTVGQFTGLTDKNGKKIFDGDVIHELDGSMDDIPRRVRWDEEYMDFRCPIVRKHWAYGNNNCSLWLMESENIEVIGNIHDNPELLEVEDGK